MENSTETIMSVLEKIEKETNWIKREDGCLVCGTVDTGRFFDEHGKVCVECTEGLLPS